MYVICFHWPTFYGQDFDDENPSNFSWLKVAFARWVL